jgi:feruloyl-CoA synthase
VFPNIAECRSLCPGLAVDAPTEQVLSNPAVLSRVRLGMDALAQAGGGSSMVPTRALLMGEPPSVEAGEITDKGYINQRAVLNRRTDLVQMLYADMPDPSVVTAGSASMA